MPSVPPKTPAFFGGAFRRKVSQKSAESAPKKDAARRSVTFQEMRQKRGNRRRALKIVKTKIVKIAKIAKIAKTLPVPIDKQPCVCYNTCLCGSIRTKIRTGIEAVITALTRNQVVAQAARGFESHRFRQRNALLLKDKGRFFLPISVKYRKLYYFRMAES